VEEWADVPNRLSEIPHMLSSNLGEGNTVQILSRRHIGFPAEQFPRVEQPMREMGIVKEGKIGDAKVLYHRTKALFEVLVPMLEENPGLFDPEQKKN
ncbi:MAG: aminoglycoside N(3)-acetyltransferase, partial [Spirochaetia bacterium]|nr:aminoglycoside N(3)-acetyltransferase [Spirochaetia bacterium]